MEQKEPQDQQRASEGVPGDPVRAPGSTLGRRLGGDLPCVVCRYNLKSLSIRSVCPECGTPVRATILSIVDPLATELTPIPRRGLVAGGLFITALGALGTTVLLWLPYIGVRSDVWRDAVMVCIGASALGALTLVRPHGGIPARSVVMASAAVLLYLPVIYVVWLLTDPTVLRASSGFELAWDIGRRVLWLRAILTALSIGIMLLLRPNIRLLVARSLVLRTGRVDRQTLLAIAGAAGAALLGRLLLVGATQWRVLAADGRIIGTVLVFLGTSLVTLGLAGAVVDCWRIARAIVTPSPTLRQVLGRSASPKAPPAPGEAGR